MSQPNLDAELLGELLAAMPAVVLVVGLDRKIRFLNRAEIGYRIEDAIGVDAAAFIPEDARAEWVSQFERVIATPESASVLAAVKAADGGSRGTSRRSFRWSATAGWPPSRSSRPTSPSACVPSRSSPCSSA